MRLVAVILTYNEEKHLARCIDSLVGLVDDTFVVDCFSTDATVQIARAHNVQLLQREWINHSTQFNWALTKIPSDTDWVLRIDADEIVSSELWNEIKSSLASVDQDIDGIYLNRRMSFQGSLIRYGGVFPVRVLRLFRFGKGECENRWMDEHIKVLGATLNFNGEIIDDSLNTLTWWIDKHNNYSSREVIDLLNYEYKFMPSDSVAKLLGGGQVGFKRWIKENIYSNLPLGARAFAYFFYRYVIRFGFLDGQAGASFHFLQGFWYRYLVDLKLLEVRRYMRQNGCHVKTAIERVLGIKV
jgi:glycosyltransferase involved in cell wall biosynthesis